MSFNYFQIISMMGANKCNVKTLGADIFTTTKGSVITTNVEVPKNTRKAKIYIWGAGATGGKNNGGGGGGFILLEAIVIPRETVTVSINQTGTNTGYTQVIIKGQTFRANEGTSAGGAGGTYSLGIADGIYLKILNYANGQAGSGSVGGNCGGINYIAELYGADKMYGVGGKNNYGGYTNSSNNGNAPGGGYYDNNSGTLYGSGHVLFVLEGGGLVAFNPVQV